MSLDETRASPWEEIALSIFRAGAFLLRHRRQVLLWMFFGGAIGVGVAFARRPRYTASATFMPQSGGDANSNLRSIAGQFGIPISAANPEQSPAFYQDLATSLPILAPIAADSFVTDAQGRRQSFADLVEVDAPSPAIRAEKATEHLRKSVSASVDKDTGIITVTATTQWRLVSLNITSRILQAINDFNLRTRQSQASAERRFVENRLTLATGQLRSAEDGLQRFLEGNRQIDAPRVKFDMDRLQRSVSLQQQVVATLSQALEDARLREVRNTPVITIIQQATARVEPDPRGATALGTLGILTGGVFAVLIALFGELARRTRSEGRPDAASFDSALHDTARDFGRFWPWRRRSMP